MGNATRREFMATAGKAALATGMLTVGATATDPGNILEKKFLHHVFIWLKNPESREDKAKLIEGMKKLTAIKAIRFFHIGQPAATNRSVVDRSYSVSWLIVFDNAADEESYQKDPIHLDFVKECSPLWTKVVVYDAVQA